MFEVEIQTADAPAGLYNVANNTRRLRSLMRVIACALESVTN